MNKYIINFKKSASVGVFVIGGCFCNKHNALICCVNQKQLFHYLIVKKSIIIFFNKKKKLKFARLTELYVQTFCVQFPYFVKLLLIQMWLNKKFHFCKILAINRFPKCKWTTFSVCLDINLEVVNNQDWSSVINLFSSYSYDSCPLYLPQQIRKSGSWSVNHVLARVRNLTIGVM